jgi:prevent-host-death family protein
MTTVSALDAKTRFGELLARVAVGEEIVITRHHKPGARILPEGRRSLRQVGEAVETLFKFRAGFSNRCGHGPRALYVPWL